MSKVLDDRLIALKIDLLRPGMYVASLDRLWLNTPFPPVGFYVRNQKQINKLGRYCTYVYIDPQKSREPLDVTIPFDLLDSDDIASPGESLSIGAELPWARKAMHGLSDAVREMIREVRIGRLPDRDTLYTGLIPVVDSIKRNPDALMWLLRTEEFDGYIYRRSVGTAVISVMFGNKLGFDRKTILELALGGVLMDIGKIEVPVPVLAKTDLLSPEEHGIIRKHVNHAVDLVRIMDNVPNRVVEMVRGHHERFDGSGYPHKKIGADIPLYARIAGIVDTFDAITQDRRYAPAISSHTALRYLNGQRHKKFDDDLLQEFIRAVGLYPTGTWVELHDGSVGVVAQQNPDWPLSPRVAVVGRTTNQRVKPHNVEVSRANPIVRARHRANPGMYAPDLDTIT